MLLVLDSAAHPAFCGSSHVVDSGLKCRPAGQIFKYAIPSEQKKNLVQSSRSGKSPPLVGHLKAAAEATSRGSRLLVVEAVGHSTFSGQSHTIKSGLNTRPSGQVSRTAFPPKHS
jgi:hypothetical protein